MGDFALDTAVEGGDGRYTARLSPEWEIWGPCGGYVAAVLLRAAGAHTRFDRPASLMCHFFGVADFGEVDLATETLRDGKRSESVQVTLRQGGRDVCRAMVWSVAGDAEGFEVDWTRPPDVPAPRDVPTAEERMGDDWKPWYPFWNNVEYRALRWRSPEEWEARTEPDEPTWQAWVRYRPTAAYEDPFVEAARVALLFDVMGWPAVHQAIDPAEADRWMAPNPDVAVWFCQPTAGTEFLLVDAEAPLSTGGLVTAWGRVWSEDGRLLAHGAEQLLCRAVPPPRPE